MVPRSTFPTAVWLKPAAFARANTDNPCAIRASWTRAATPKARNPSVAAGASWDSVESPNARKPGESPSASAIFSTVSSRGTWPRFRSMRNTVLPSGIPASAAALLGRPRSCVPKILTEATVLDLGIPAEKSVHDFLLRAASGHSPLFRVEAMNRNGNTLLVVIESCQGSPFVLALSLTKKTLSLRSWYPSKDEAKLAIVEHPTRTETSPKTTFPSPETSACRSSKTLPTLPKTRPRRLIGTVTAMGTGNSCRV